VCDMTNLTNRQLNRQSSIKQELSEVNASFCHGGIHFRSMMMLNSASASYCRSSPSQNC